MVASLLLHVSQQGGWQKVAIEASSGLSLLQRGYLQVGWSCVGLHWGHDMSAFFGSGYLGGLAHVVPSYKLRGIYVYAVGWVV